MKVRGGKTLTGVFVRVGEEGVYDVKRGRQSAAQLREVLDDGSMVLDEEQQAETFGFAAKDMDLDVSGAMDVSQTKKKNSDAKAIKSKLAAQKSSSSSSGKKSKSSGSSSKSSSVSARSFSDESGAKSRVSRLAHKLSKHKASSSSCKVDDSKDLKSSQKGKKRTSTGAVKRQEVH